MDADLVELDSQTVQEENLLANMETQGDLCKDAEARELGNYAKEIDMLQRMIREQQMEIITLDVSLNFDFI